MSITITYGSYTIPFIIEKFRETVGYRNYSIEVDFLITGATDLDFKNNLVSAEDALTKDSQKLEVKFGTEVHRSFDPANYTGLLARGNLTKSAGPEDTARSRRYTWRCEIQLPADDLTNDNYRREASWSYEFNESRRKKISFQGTYTAGGGNTAFSNYNANIETWTSSVFTGLSLTKDNFEVIYENISFQDDENAILQFSITYQEVKFPEDSSGTSSSPNSVFYIRNAQVTFSRSSENQKGDNTKPAYRVNVQYSCNVDVDDLVYGDYKKLKELYVNKIKPHLITQAKTVFGGALSAVEREDVNIDVAGSAISVSMSILMGTGNSILSYSETIEIMHDLQRNYRKKWDGKPYTYVFWSPGEKITAFQTVNVESISSLSSKPSAISPSSSELKALTSPGNGSWQLLTEKINNTPRVIGKDQDGKGKSIKIFSTSWSSEYIWVSDGKQVSLDLPPKDDRPVTPSGQYFLRKLQNEG